MGDFAGAVSSKCKRPREAMVLLWGAATAAILLAAVPTVKSAIPDSGSSSPTAAAADFERQLSESRGVENGILVPIEPAEFKDEWSMKYDDFTKGDGRHVAATNAPKCPDGLEIEQEEKCRQLAPLFFSALKTHNKQQADGVTEGIVKLWSVFLEAKMDGLDDTLTTEYVQKKKLNLPNRKPNHCYAYDDGSMRGVLDREKQQLMRDKGKNIQQMSASVCSACPVYTATAVKAIGPGSFSLVCNDKYKEEEQCLKKKRLDERECREAEAQFAYREKKLFDKNLKENQTKEASIRYMKEEQHIFKSESKDGRCYRISNGKGSLSLVVFAANSGQAHEFFQDMALTHFEGAETRTVPEVVLSYLGLRGDNEKKYEIKELCKM